MLRSRLRQKILKQMTTLPERGEEREKGGEGRGERGEGRDEKKGVGESAST